MKCWHFIFYFLKTTDKYKNEPCSPKLALLYGDFEMQVNAPLPAAHGVLHCPGTLEMTHIAVIAPMNNNADNKNQRDGL